MKFFIVCALFLGFAGWGLITTLAFLALFSEGRLLLDFNAVGELHFELWFFPVCLFLVLIGTLQYCGGKQK